MRVRVPQEVLHGGYSVSGLARRVVVPLAPVRIWLDTLQWRVILNGDRVRLLSEMFGVSRIWFDSNALRNSPP